MPGIRRTNNMAELKPCRCKNPDSAIYGTVNLEGEVRYKCICINCGKETKEYSTEQQAIDAWNKRS